MISVDLKKSAGTIRRIHGGNLGPQISSYSPEREKQFAELEIPVTRLHDAPLNNPGMRLADIQLIFGNMNADANLEQNYYFRETDEYIDLIRRSGSDIMYRLGTSIEFSMPRHFSMPPPDFEKYSDICLNIVRHFNSGWASGHHWNIKYWELWNEPDDSGDENGSYMWNGSCEEYCRLYEMTVRKIKAEFPKIKFGGASFWKWRNNAKNPARHTFIKEFLEFCGTKGLPLDFFSWHRYSSPDNPFDLIDEPAEIRQALDSRGFTQTELHNTEWRYIHEWNQAYMENGEHNPGSITAAAHYTSALTAWQDTPLDMSYSYTSGGQGPFAPWLHGEARKLYYGMRAFTEITHFPCRVRAVSDTENLRVLAGTNGKGEFCVLLSDFMVRRQECELEIAGAVSDDIVIVKIDREQNWEECGARLENKKIRLKLPDGDSCIYLIKGTSA